ncbi:MAG: [FeFe] hydrogenase H-cluster radical SAM maturase HydG, partial [Patescibacteria group bacterium]
MKILDEQEVGKILEDKKIISEQEFSDILNKAKLKNGLDVEEVGALLNIEDENLLQRLFEVAKTIKREIYGNRLVLFAPLYVSDFCVNNCKYCGFHMDNKTQRKKLTLDEVAQQVKILEDMGHKRLLLEFGEDDVNNPIDYVVEVIKTIYGHKSGNGEIRRVNVNIAATSVENYKKLKEAGIGTYQLFQETYHRPTYEKLHQGPKADYERQITAHERAFEAGIDDYGMGVLFGLYNYKFEVLSLISHVKYLEEKLGVGPHTISVPRYNPASTVDFESNYKLSDKDFLKLIAIIRLAVPYTGMIISTRETPEIRKQAFQIGISQTSAGSRTSPGGYGQDECNEQFDVHDHRTLDEVIADICEIGYLPSFCTACYRTGRTGENFMDLAKDGQI